MREDEDVADEVRKILEEDGIEVLLNASAQSVRREGDGVEVTVKAAGGDAWFRVRTCCWRWAGFRIATR